MIDRKFIGPLDPQQILERRFLASVERQDVVGIREALACGVSVDVSFQGWTSLQWAVQHRLSRAVDALLAHGSPDLGAVSPDRERPLHRAMRNYSPHIVQALLNAGADVHALDPQGRTALAALCDLCVGSSQMEGVLEQLLEHGADPHAPGPQGKTPWQVCQANPHGKTWCLRMDQHHAQISAGLLGRATARCAMELLSRRL